MEDIVANTVDKWLLKETHHKLRDADLEDTPVNNLCLTVIPVAHTYCRAILQLVKTNAGSNANCILPAMGLLRVLAELTLRTCWCLSKPEPNIKVLRWLKQSYIERTRLLEKTVMVCTIPDKDKEDCLKEIKELTKYINDIPHKPAGKLWDCIKELPDVYKDIYRLLYGVMHRGIHPDILVLGDTLRQEGVEMVSLGDFEHIPSNVLWKHCINIVYELVAHIQTYYEWDTKNLKAKHGEIIKNLENMSRISLKSQGNLQA